MADQTSTLTSSYVNVLSAQQRATTGFTHCFRIPYTEVYNASQTTQGDTKTITIGTTPARYTVDRVMVDITTAYATTGTLTVSVGTSANTALLLAAVTAKTAGVNTAAAGCVPANKTEGTSAATLQVRFTTQSATGAISDITAGDLYVYLRVIDLTSVR